LPVTEASISGPARRRQGERRCADRWDEMGRREGRAGANPRRRGKGRYSIPKRKEMGREEKNEREGKDEDGNRREGKGTEKNTHERKTKNVIVFSPLVQ